MRLTSSNRMRAKNTNTTLPRSNFGWGIGDDKVTHMKITNVHIVNASHLLKHHDVWIEHGKIQQIAPSIEKRAAIEIDGTGHYLMPGFIDMHIHGSANADVMDATEQALHTLAASLVQEGVTSFLATTMTQQTTAIEAALQTVAQFEAQDNEAQLLGIHLEGPFISEKRVGAQPLEYVAQPNVALFQKWQQLSGNRIMQVTLAPEVDGGKQLLQTLREQGIVASIGHSDATFHEVQDAIATGITQATHLYNQMRPFHHRDPGVVGGVLLSPNVKVEVIADYIHSHPQALELAYRMKGASGLILITDAMRAKGLPYGEYDLGGQAVYVTEKGAHLAQGNLAGSVLTMDAAIRNMQQATGCSICELVAMTSFNAAEQLQLPNKGVITEQADADVVLMSAELTVQATIIAGKIVYEQLEGGEAHAR